jgi:hypothetical protein
MDSSNWFFTIKSCACPSTAFIAGTISWSVDQTQNIYQNSLLWNSKSSRICFPFDTSFYSIQVLDSTTDTMYHFYIILSISSTSCCLNSRYSVTEQYVRIVFFMSSLPYILSLFLVALLEILCKYSALILSHSW